ncbi:hypothetical protein N7488_010216 [Penicillium malachiteum]|nr:hypothetical protein N7488_010216 [Penicillium malachiteum]
MGFSADYVLDGILALAALHIARYNKSRRPSLLSYAIECHSRSVSRATPLIPVVTPQNSSPLYIFGILTLFFNLARPLEQSDEQSLSNKIIPEWLYLIRGVDTVVMAEGSAVKSSPVALIFKSTWGSMEYWQSHTPEICLSLKELEEKICAETRADMERQEILIKTIQALNRSYSFLYGPVFPDQDKLRGFYQWLFEIDEPYLSLVKSGDNAALCILGFYAVLLKDLERYWWMEGWSVHLIKGIHMLLDGEHRLWIRWAIEEIGWVPETTWSE